MKCDNCIHDNVCSYKKDYKTICEQLAEIKILDTTEKVLFSIEVNCDYFKKVEPVIRSPLSYGKTGGINLLEGCYNGGSLK